jgi:hypothetical protein
MTPLPLPYIGTLKLKQKRQCLAGLVQSAANCKRWNRWIQQDMDKNLGNAVVYCHNIAGYLEVPQKMTHQMELTYLPEIPSHNTTLN